MHLKNAYIPIPGVQFAVTYLKKSNKCISEKYFPWIENLRIYKMYREYQLNEPPLKISQSVITSRSILSSNSSASEQCGKLNVNVWNK